MKGYIYTMFKGADPAEGWEMTDPIFKPVPTMGACMPNIRRVVVPGDYIFMVSGRVPKVQQYVVGGFQVAEKIDALAARDRFPENLLAGQAGKNRTGNIIVNEDGTQDPLDYHGNFDKRIANYLVGTKPVLVETPPEVARSRKETLTELAGLFGKRGREVYEVMGRWRRLDSAQIDDLLGWLKAIKTSEA
jgi:hypothetical protein